MKKNVENRTMSAILEELNNSVDKYNLTPTSEVVERAELADRHKKLVDEYNEASLLNAYADCMNANVPVVALAKMYYYKTIAVKDAVHNEIDPVTRVKKSSITRSVNEGCRKLDIAKFIKWTEECNKCVAASKDWRTKIFAVRNSIETEWKRFFASKADKKDISIGKVKRAMQEAFDALVFIPCENSTDKNAVIATGDVAKFVIAFANSRKDSKVDGVIKITGEILPLKMWTTLLLDVLHMAVEKKSYDLVYGTEVEDAKNAKTQTEAPAEAETETDAE